MAPDDTKLRLLDSAGKVFAAKGYEAATVREICEAAGANVAAINYYFGDKQRLYHAACQTAECARADAVPMPDWPPNTPATDRLRDFVHTFLRRLLEEERPAWHRQLMLRELAFPTEACAQIVEDSIRPCATVLKQIVQDLMPSDLPESESIPIAFSIVGQCLFYHVHRPIAVRLVGEQNYDRLTIDRLTDHITRFTLAALGYGPPFVDRTEESPGQPAAAAKGTSP